VCGRLGNLGEETITETSSSGNVQHV